MKIRRWDNTTISSYFYLFPFICYTHQAQYIENMTDIITTEKGIYFGWLKYVFYIPMIKED
jgi:hypothetical protein